MDKMDVVDENIREREREEPEDEEMDFDLPPPPLPAPLRRESGLNQADLFAINHLLEIPLNPRTRETSEAIEIARQLRDAVTYHPHDRELYQMMREQFDNNEMISQLRRNMHNGGKKVKKTKKTKKTKKMKKTKKVKKTKKTKKAKKTKSRK